MINVLKSFQIFIQYQFYIILEDKVIIFPYRVDVVISDPLQKTCINHVSNRILYVADIAYKRKIKHYKTVYNMIKPDNVKKFFFSFKATGDIYKKIIF